MDNRPMDNPAPPVTPPREISIPQEVQQILDRLNPDVPRIFHEQAAATARYISTLDSRQSTTDPAVQKFVQQLSEAGFISLVSLKDNIKWMRGADPKKALPIWLQTNLESQENPKQQKQRVEEEKQIQQRFGLWTKAKRYPYDDKPDGRYFRLKADPSHIPSSHHYKCYIEGHNLAVGFSKATIPALFEVLASKNLLPASMKLFEEGRLVLYFDSDITRYGEIEPILQLYGVQSRGPAQDVIEMQVMPNGQLHEDVYTSNDGALGEGGKNPRHYEVQQYTPAAFLESYLNMCLYGGKAPNQPYITSFVYLSDPNGLGGDRKKELIREAEQLVQYPILYVNGYRIQTPLLVEPSSSPDTNMPTNESTSTTIPLGRRTLGFVRRLMKRD